MPELTEHASNFDQSYYFGQRVDGFNGATYNYDHPDQKYQLKWKRTHFKKEYKSILFVGCGPGFEVRHWREMGKQAFGIDVSPFAIQWIKENSPDIRDYCKLGDGVSLPYETDSMDVVASFDCLVLCPADVRPNLIAEMCRVARKQIIVRTRPLTNQPILIRDETGEWHGRDGVNYRYEPLEYWVSQFELSGKFRYDGFDQYPGDRETHIFRFDRR